MNEVGDWQASCKVEQAEYDFNYVAAHGSVGCEKDYY